MSNCDASVGDSVVAALADLASNLGFNDVTGLLQSQFDLLCRQLCILLRRHLIKRTQVGSPDRPRGLCLLLGVLLKLHRLRTFSQDPADTVTVPELGDIMDVLVGQLDLSWLDPDPTTTLDILNIILTFVESFQHADDQQAKKVDERSGGEDRGVLTRLVLDLRESDRLLFEDREVEECPEDGFHQPKQGREAEAVDEDDGAPAKTIPDRVKFLKKAIEHSRHFVSMVAHPSWQIASMKIVAYAVKVVQVDQETLLPLIHQTWQPLKLLFESDNIFVVSEAFSVLRIFAAVAKDFIHRRTVDEAFPGVMRCLHRIKSVVQDRNFRNTTLGRQSRNLLADIVAGLWQFMGDLNLRESETELIIDEMIEFVELSKSKPKMFEAQNFQPVRTMDDDILWLKLMYRRNVQV